MKELIIPPLRLKQIETSQEPLLVEDEQFVKTFLKAFNLDENDERTNDDPVKTKNQSITRQRRKQTNRQTNRQSNRQTNRSIRRKSTRRKSTTRRSTNRNTDRSWYKDIIDEHNQDVVVKHNIAASEGTTYKNTSNNPTIITIKNKMEESNSNKPSTNIFISPLKGNNEINTNRYRKSKSSSSMLLSPRTVENILTMANDDARNGNRASLRDLRDAKRGVTPKINDIATDRALIFKADRHVMPLQRHSLHGATTDCYYAPSGKRQSIKKHFAKSKEIFPRGKMIYTKTTVNAQHHWVHNLNRKKYDLKQIASKPGRGRAPPYASKWLNKMVPVNMELRELPVLTPQTQHFCANVDMPFNPFLQYEHQAYLRAERKRLKQEKLEWEEYEYQMKKQEVEEYKYRIYEEPKIEREAERRRQEQELKKLQAMQKKADEGFKFKKKKRKRKGKRGSDTQQTPQTTEYGNGALAATV